MLVYARQEYDPEDPWSGLFRAQILVWVGTISCKFVYLVKLVFSQAYKHIFTSPSSVEKEPKATRSGNARIHGMNCVTTASIGYAATQVFFFDDALSALSLIYLLTLASFRPFFRISLLPVGYVHGFRAIL
jgi:hypothetical protein